MFCFCLPVHVHVSYCLRLLIMWKLWWAFRTCWSSLGVSPFRVSHPPPLLWFCWGSHASYTYNTQHTQHMNTQCTISYYFFVTESLCFLHVSSAMMSDQPDHARCIPVSLSCCCPCFPPAPHSLHDCSALCGLAGSPQIVRCVVLPPVDSVLDALCPDRPKGKPAAAEGKRDKKKVRVAEAEDASGDEVRWFRTNSGEGVDMGDVLGLYSGDGAHLRGTFWGSILGLEHVSGCNSGCGVWDVRVIVRTGINGPL
jgi:hypothetical protein